MHVGKGGIRDRDETGHRTGKKTGFVLTFAAGNGRVTSAGACYLSHLLLITVYTKGLGPLLKRW